MTIHSYLYFVATQPLLLRLAMVVIIVLSIGVLYATAECLRNFMHRSRSEKPVKVAMRAPSRALNTVYFG